MKSLWRREKLETFAKDVELMLKIISAHSFKDMQIIVSFLVDVEGKNDGNAQCL